MTYLLILILAIAWLWLYRRVRDLESELRYALERRSPPSLVPQPAQAAPALAPRPAVAPASPAALPLRGAPPPRVEPAPAQPATPAPERREWETLIGGSVLNAIGAVVLVIGIALFLAYSFAHMTAAGRAILAFLASVTILGAGVWIEPKPRYRMFARGLIGAGWAALYATAYAIWAIPAARVVPSAAAGSAIQLAVAVGMVAHSLRYRAQAVTAIAYSAVFAALAVAPSSPLAVASLVPIAASVLYLAARFEWDSMPIFGLLATYATCIARGESGGSLAASQGVFLAYWLIFELFDLRRVKLGRVAGGLEFLFPLNTVGFLGLSYIAWTEHAPDQMWIAAACGSALFLASSVIRARLRHQPSSEFVDRARAGSYEASLVVSAVLAILAIIGRAPGIWAAAALAVEAELIYLAGLRFDSNFLSRLGTAIFAFSLARLMLTTEPDRRAAIMGHAWRDWTPAVLFHAALFYWNRTLRRSELIYSYAATVLIAIVLLGEVPHSAIGLAWVVFGCGLLQFGVARALGEFERQGLYLLGGGALVGCAYVLMNPQGIWWPLAVASIILFACVRQLRDVEWFEFVASASAAVFLWRVMPHREVALTWAALALALDYFGMSRPAYSLGFGALATAVATDIDPPRLVVSIPTAALFYAAQFLSRGRGAKRAALYQSLLGTVLAAAILWGRISGGLFTVAWGLLGLSLLGCGFAARDRNLRLEGLALLLICILKLFVYDLRNLETIYRILSFVALGLILLSVSWIYSRFRDQVERLVR